MKLIIENNKVSELGENEKIDFKNLDVIEYRGVLEDNEEIIIYDKEAGKIAPLVRYLLEGDSKKKSILIYLIGFGIVGILFIGFIIFGFGTKKATTDIKDTTGIKDIQTIKGTGEIENNGGIGGIKQDSFLSFNENIKECNNDSFNTGSIEQIKYLNEELMNCLNNKNNVVNINSNDLDKLKLEFKNEEYLKEIEELKEDNNKLKEDNNNLILINEDLRSKELKTDKDFILYLGNNIWNTCNNEKTNLDTIEKCKSLYFNYKNDKKQ